MVIPWTIFRYIFRELAKTFALAAVALTGVLGLGGGVLNMIKLGEVTPGQLLRLLSLALPVAAALTLPIAALFTAAATYGRLSADNEFVACRASGINIHWLLGPTVLLGLVTAGATFGFSNFVVPEMVRNLNEFTTSDVTALLKDRLHRPRGLTLGGRYRIHADDTDIDASRPGQVALNHIVFVEVERDEWVRFGTARHVVLKFERSEGRLRVSGRMIGLSFFDRIKGQFADVEEQVLPTNELQSLVPPEIKFLTLTDLRRFRRSPAQWHAVRDCVEDLRSVLVQGRFNDWLWDQWRKTGLLHLTGPTAEYTLRAKTAGRMPRDGSLELHDAGIEELRDGDRRRYQAGRIVLESIRGSSGLGGAVRIEAYDVSSIGGKTPESRKMTFSPIPVPPEAIGSLESASDAELQDAAAHCDTEPITKRFAKLQEEILETSRRITGAIHERSAFSVSVIVLILLASALGIVFRGAHLVTAFGISFVPAILVMTAIISGKQLANNAGTHVAGLWLMWGGIMMVAALDGLVLARWVRR